MAARLVGLEATRLAGHEEAIRSLLRLNPPAEGFAASASLAAEDITVELDVAGAVDVAAERRRLEKDLAAARTEAGQAERKLANADFTAKAPAAVVDKTRARLTRPAPTSPASSTAWKAFHDRGSFWPNTAHFDP